MKRVYIIVLVLMLLASAALATRIWFELQPSITRIDIPIEGAASDSGLPLRVAVLGDLHVGHGVVDMEVLERLFDSVIAERPDIIFFVGGYTRKIWFNSEGISIIDEGVSQLRQSVVALVEEVSLHVPTYAVLGRDEVWTGEDDAWLEAFRRTRAVVLENEIAVTVVGNAQVCIRGLGAYPYTAELNLVEVEWPESCTDKIKITLTHDPARAFDRPSEGVIFAGHTHCGQIRLPVIGALGGTTEAPKDARCGLYRDADRTLYVTSGVGTSLLPLRLGAPSAWDLVTLKKK